MACLMCPSCFCPVDPQKERDRQITRWIEAERRRHQLEVKILLLGTGEAGKSTFLRQMRILHGEGYSIEQRKEFKKWVYRNVFLAIQGLLNGREKLKLSFENADTSSKMADIVSAVDCWFLETIESPELFDAVRYLWKNEPVIMECYNRRNEFDLTDSANYFLSSLDRIECDDYIPTQSDVLHLRIPTSGIIEYVFDIPYKKEHIRLRLVDVGGQKTERRKWVHCFDEVKTVIFLAALSEYDKMSDEYLDSDYTKLEDSMRLFHVIFTEFGVFFDRSNLILFLNKKDLFEEKVRKQKSNILEFFPDFRGSARESEAIRTHILNKFMELLPKKRLKRFYHHFTCATDTENIKTIFSVVRQRILEDHLEEIGVY